jgi:hypothetical protein
MLASDKHSSLQCQNNIADKKSFESSASMTMQHYNYHIGQGIITKGEGSVQLTSSLK